MKMTKRQEAQLEAAVEHDMIEEYIQEKWQEYLAQPSNFGADDRATRLAEEDAFKAGARAIYNEFVPF